MFPTIERINDNAFILWVGTRRWYFSYQTVVAYAEGANIKLRRDQTYSKTTAGHMTKMGVKDWEQVSDAKFEQVAKAL